MMTVTSPQAARCGTHSGEGWQSAALTLVKYAARALMKRATLRERLLEKARVQEREPLHDPEVVPPPLGAVVGHDEKLGITPLDLGRGLPRELIRPERVDSLDHGSPCFGRDSRQEAERRHARGSRWHAGRRVRFVTE